MDIRRYYRMADRDGFALGAFNFADSITAHGIAEAASALRAPIIMSTSEGESEVITPEMARAVVDALKRIHKLPIILHLDHGKSMASIKRCIAAGYDSVHLDGSSLRYAENVRLTRQAVRYAHARGVWIEGELGHIGGGSTLHAEIDYEEALRGSIYTDPEQAAEFVEKTGVDSLAVNIGNVHGVWKGKPHIDFPRLKRINKLAKCYLVLHGGSGIPDAQIRRAVRYGIDKININSEMRIAYTEELRKALGDPEQYVPRNYLPLAQDAVTRVVANKLSLFNAKGRAPGKGRQ